MRKLVVAVTVGALVAAAGPAAYGLGIPAKLKAKKVQGNLVPAYEGAVAGSGNGDDEGNGPITLQNAVLRSDAGCIFTQGKFKAQVGADLAIKLKGVTCGGVAYTGQLCAHSKVFSTIMSEDLDKDNMSTAKVCNSTAGDIAGKLSFATGNIGTLTCAAGSCSGTLGQVLADPCPDVDKVAEMRRLEVFDGPDFTSFITMGSTLSACCGPNQTTVGANSVSTHVPCDTSTQDVMGEIGTVVQGVTP